MILFVVVVGASVLLPNTKSEPLVEGVREAAATVEPGGTMTQSISLGDRLVSGLAIESTSTNAALRARVTDAQGNVVSRSFWHANGRFWFIPFTANQDTQYAFEVTNTSHESIELVVFPDNPYPIGHEREDIKMSVFEAAQGTGRTTGLVVGGLLALIMIAIPSLQRSWAAVAVTTAIATPLAVGGFWASYGHLGISDWDYYFSMHHWLRQIVVQWHQFPFWNPYTCGGTAGLADPEFSGFTPVGLLQLLFGIPLGLRLALAFSIMLGTTGMLLLARRLRLSTSAGIVAAVLFALNSSMILRFAEGHVSRMAANWLPWIVLAWLLAYQTHGRRRIAWTAGAGAGLALIFFQGGIHLLTYFGIGLFAISLLLGTRKQALLISALSTAWALGFSAVKLIPVLLWVRQFPDEAWSSAVATLSYLPSIFMGRHLHGAEVIAGQGGGWHEYGAYIGIAGILLVLSAIVLRHSSRVVRYVALAAGGAIVLSSLGPTLQPLLEELPFLPRSNVSRLNALATFPLALLAGLGLDALRSRWRWVARYAGVIVMIVLFEVFSLSYQISEQAFIVPADTDVEPTTEFLAITRQTHPIRIQGVDYDRSFLAARVGYGTLGYCTVLGPNPAIIALEDTGDSGVVTGAMVEDVQWTPNRVAATVVSEEPATVVLNTNYAQGWEANGKPAQEVEGRVGAQVPSGRHTVSFQYRTPGFGFGGLVTLGALALAIAVIQRTRRLSE